MFKTSIIAPLRTVENAMKRNRVLTRLVITVLMILIVSLLFFGVGHQVLGSPTESPNGNLLPEITNCTTQEGVSYVQDLNLYHKMNVYLPVGAGIFPAIIYIHGGGWVRGNRSEYNTMGQFYAERGIAGFSIDYTLATTRTSWPTVIQDVISAIRFIKENSKQFNIDPDRIALMGDSAGAQLASLAGMLSGDEPFLRGASGNPAISNHVSLVIDYYGPTDFKFIGEYGQSFRTYYIIGEFLGNISYQMNENLWIEASPATYITAHAPIFFVVHGTNDQIVSISISDSFVSKLNAANVETHFFRVEGGDHQILTTEEENLQVRYELEPLLKRVFNLQQKDAGGTWVPMEAVLALLLTVTLVMVVLFKKKHRHAEKPSATNAQIQF
jgi:acetyl esterase/lipase